jgi:hypothetical protein
VQLKATLTQPMTPASEPPTAAVVAPLAGIAPELAGAVCTVYVYVIKDATLIPQLFRA